MWYGGLVRLVMILASTFCLIRFVRFRVWSFAGLFVALYLISLALPHNPGSPHWHRTWLIITGVLLPARIAMLAEYARSTTANMQERGYVLSAALSASTAAVLVMLPFMPLGFDFYAFISVRQYIQVGLAVFGGMIYLYGWMRDGRAPSAIVPLILLDYAVACAFDAKTGLASGFVLITAAKWRAVRTASNLVLALCLLWWAATAKRQPDQMTGQRYQQERRYTAHS